MNYLYKYRSMDNKGLDRIFTHNEIYFPSPSELNDPFDCKIPLVMEGTDIEFRKFYDDILKGQYPDMPRAERRRATSEIIKSGRHKDPEFHRSACSQTMEYFASTFGVYCLSAKNDDILMWSHYCKGHAGFCIEFEKSENSNPFKYAKPVVYRVKYPRINYFDSTDDEKFKNLLFTKSTHWEYEEEWRIVFDKNGIEKISEEALVGLIFGCQMSENDTAKIREWLLRRRNPVRLYQAKLKTDEFGLDIIQIEE